VVVDDLHVFRAAGTPAKAEPELVIDADAVLPGPISSCRSLRRATRSNAWKRGTSQPWASVSVSAHRNDRIMPLHSSFTQNNWSMQLLEAGQLTDSHLLTLAVHRDGQLVDL